VRHDPVATDLLDQALQGQQGERTDLVDNVNEVARPNGNSAAYALRRHRPDLHRRVMAGEMTAHRAAVLAVASCSRAIARPVIPFFRISASFFG
jgi:hypothetical protein